MNDKQYQQAIQDIAYGIDHQRQRIAGVMEVIPDRHEGRGELGTALECLRNAAATLESLKS